MQDKLKETEQQKGPDRSRGVDAKAAGVVFDALSVTLNSVRVLKDVNAVVPKGGSTAIVGPNGAGKTTLINALLGQIPYRGRIHLGSGKEGRQVRMGYVPQRLDFDRDMPLTVLEYLLLGLQRLPLWFGKREKHVEEAMQNLRAVRAERLKDRRLGALSGGEMQRVMLALAIQQRPDLLVLDEPAAGVDVEGEHIICEFLDSLRERFGFTQLMVSHDLGTVSHHADHVICLNQTVVAEGPPKEVFTPENLAAIYGIHMGVLDMAFMPDDQREEQCRGEHDHD